MWIALSIIFSAIGVSKSLPAPVSSLQYDSGLSYKYSYQLTILLNEDSNITSRSAAVGRNVGYKVSSEFLLSNVWQSSSDPKEKLLKLELLKPTLLVSSTMHSTEGINRHWSKLDNLSYPPIYIHWNDGIVQKVYLLPDSQSLINIKKGIASLLQLHVSNTPTKEADVAGICEVRYKTAGNTIRKNKYNCQKSSSIPKQQSSELRMSTITSTSEMIVDLIPQENIIQTLTSREEVMMTLNMWKQAAVFVKSKIHVNFIDRQKNPFVISATDVKSALGALSKEMGQSFKEETLEIESDPNICIGNCKPLMELVKEYSENMHSSHLGKVKSAAGFLKLLDGFRRASKKDIFMVFKKAEEAILTQLLDVLAATQSTDALDVAFELVEFESKDTTIAERFLLCLATVPYPNEDLIVRTLKLLHRKLKSEKVRATILVTLSSLIRTYCKNNPKNKGSVIVKDVSDLFLRELGGCHHIICVLNHLLALKNAALPEHIPILLEYIKKGGILGLVAMEALKEIGEEHFNKEVKNVLFRAYFQFWPHQESAARVLAAELLIKSDSTISTVGSLVLSLASREQPEISTLVLSKVYSAMKKNDAISSCVKEVLRNTTFGNYNYLAQNGTSTSYEHLLLATHDVNVTYGINMEMRPAGMLKRTSLDLGLQNNHENLHLISLGLFVEGFGLSDEEQKENPEEHSAGMQLSVLGVHLRPYIFFTGTAELMGLVWSGVGGEPTPALQANFLIMDQMQSIVLQNGISVDFMLKGALSADVSGTVEISMWNKNAHAKVKNSGALLVNGFCRVDTSFVESHVDFALGGSSALDMVVDLDFGKKPMKICLQVEQPDYIFRHNVRKTETIPGSKHLIKTLKRRSIHFPGRSFNLHKKNSDSCKELLLPKKQASSFW
ncbi:microsomal triglyceride transfer protein large subunit-like [Uloborus diversus]|uniref:microsomal triglyceride transfer protein large subunit-like n=1 Tax=Uloborus diversus TaxID=327109 RepID=UPI00240A48F8|nr:microsomal triglyceride transfer protein large subunit-like [Uloborus diversus]